MSDRTRVYLEQLKLWAIYVLAILALAVASALAQRWLGRPVDLPPPPVILVQTDADGTVTVKVVGAKGAKHHVAPDEWGGRSVRTEPLK